MRIKAEGDLKAAKGLIDQYALKVDPDLRVEVQNRVRKLDAPAYTGFVMPKLIPSKDINGNIADIEVTYPLDLSSQMIEYSTLTRQNLADEIMK